MNDPKYIDKRPLRIKKQMEADRAYTARIAHAEDMFFAGADTEARREKFRQAMNDALRMLREDEAQIDHDFPALELAQKGTK